MKKFLSIFTAASMLLAMTACSSPADSSASDSSSAADSSASAAQTAESSQPVLQESSEAGGSSAAPTAEADDDRTDYEKMVDRSLLSVGDMTRMSDVFQKAQNGEDITIVGIVQPDYTASASMLTSGIAYPASLTEKVMEDAADSDIVKQQMADPATNVLTGESFGKAESLRDFDLTSLFSIDTNALKNAFSFDADALDFDLNGAFDLSSGSFDLSSLIDFSDFSLDIDELPDIDLSDAFAELDLSVSPEALQDLVHKVFKDYKKYIIGNGILNFKKWSFSSYLKSEQFQKLMAESMKDLVDPDKLQGQLSSALQTTIQSVMET